MHRSNPFFLLTEDEYALAMKKYRQLNDDTEVIYEKSSASGSINVCGDNHFDNQNVLIQFDCFFQLLPFKK